MPDVGLGAEADGAAASAPESGLSAPAAVTPRNAATARVFARPSPSAGRRNVIYVSRGGFWIRLLVPLIIVAAVAIPLIGVGNSINSAVKDISRGTSSSGGASPQPAPAPATDFMSTIGLRTGLASLEHLAPGARLTLLRIDSDSLSATATLANGSAKEIYLGPAGTEVLSTSPTGERPIASSQIKPAVVDRLLAQMKKRFQIAPRQLDYMVLSSPPGVAIQWVLFAKGPTPPGFTALLNGSGLGRIPS